LFDPSVAREFLGHSIGIDAQSKPKKIGTSSAIRISKRDNETSKLLQKEAESCRPAHSQRSDADHGCRQKGKGYVKLAGISRTMPVQGWTVSREDVMKQNQRSGGCQIESTMAINKRFKEAPLAKKKKI
jgi:hypothetical protein